jgi:hypothetical protein
MYVDNKNINYKIITWLLLIGFGIFSFPFSWFGLGIGNYLLRGFLVLSCVLMIVMSVLNKHTLTLHPLHIMLFGFLLFYSIRLYLDATSGKYNFDMTNDVLLLRFISMVWIPFVFISFLNIKEIPVKLCQISLLIICCLALVTGLISGFGERLSGNNILNPTTLGYYAGMLVVITFYSIKVLSIPMKNPVNFISVGIGSAVLVFSLSRGAVFSTGIVVFMLMRFKGFKKMGRSDFGFVLAAFVTVIAVILSDSGITTARMEVNFDSGDSTGDPRVILWFLASEKIFANPLFGSSVTTEIGYLHNIYLESIMAVGLCGSALLFWPLWTMMFRYRKKIKLKKHISCGVFLFIFWGIASLFTGTIYNSEFFWITLPMALNCLMQSNDSPTRKLKGVSS